MLIKYNHSMEVANQVLDNVIKCLFTLDDIKKTDNNDGDASIEAYSNCREQGYCIKRYNRKDYKIKVVCFAENRNSDQIVVYFSDENKFEMQGNIPDDDSYRNANYFNDVKSAVKFIVEYISR